MYLEYEIAKNRVFYFILSSEINAYQKQLMILIINEMI